MDETPGIVIDPRMMPRLSPLPALPRLADVSMILLPEFRAPKLVPPPTYEFVPFAPWRYCHWMPNSAERSALTSTINASMNTCARRVSSFSTIARMLLYTGAERSPDQCQQQAQNGGCFHALHSSVFGGWLAAPEDASSSGQQTDPVHGRVSITLH